ncbi:hypothetical protein HanPI659440_Chr06g0236341 [Helianthus annuus]|nr:hypothetical protein HanPI659440_Chr06g0236341 [Helianthus annuus]
MFNACFAGPSKKSPPRLVDDPVDIIQQGIGLMKESLEGFLKKNEEATAAKVQSSSVEKIVDYAKHVQVESLKEKEPEGVAHTDSSDADDESSETESEIDKSNIGVGKVQLKKKPQKKRNGSDEEDSTYIPTAEEKKKQRRKRKAVQSGVIPRSVRAKKGGATMPEFQSGKSEKNVVISKGPEAVKNVEKKAGDDDEVVITEERMSTPPPPPVNPSIHIPDDAETSKPKKTTLPDLFEGFPNIHGEFKDAILPDEDYNMFHDATVKELTKKMSILEKEKAKAEAERDELKKHLEKITKLNEEMKSVVKNHAKRIKTLVEDVDDNAKLFEQLSEELSEVNVKYANMNETNQTLHQMLDELHEASANEIKVLKLEIKALRADKAVKDEELNMLYTMMEHHLGINVQSIYNNLEIQRVEERRAQREKELAEAATQKKKDVIVETQEAGGSSRQPEGDVEMVDVVNVEGEHMDVDQDQGFVLVGNGRRKRAKGKG